MTNRPKFNDPRVIESAAQELLPRVREWMENDGDNAGILDDLKNAIRWNDDGYEIAKSLDDCGWMTVDFSLCEILDSVFSLKHEAHQKLVRDWVSEAGPGMIFAVGDTVKTPRGLGIVNGVRNETAAYVVTPPDDPRFKHGGGMVVNAEDCEAAP